MSAIAAEPPVEPYVLADTAPFRTSLLGTGIFGVVVYAATVVPAAAASIPAPSDVRLLVNRVLAELGDSAPWLLPMVLSALIAGLAIALVPGWAQGHKQRMTNSNFEDLRLLVGYMCIPIAALFLVWALWIVTALIVPGWSPGPSGSGVLIAVLLIAVLATLGARAARGTLSQRYLDARRTRWRLLRRRRRTRLQTIFRGTRPARWPACVVLVLCALVATMPVALTVSGRLDPVTSLTVFGVVAVFGLLPLALSVHSFFDPGAHQLATSISAIAGILVAALAVLAFAGLDWIGFVAAGLVLSLVAAVVPWPRKYLLAGFGHAPLEKAIASNDEYLSVLRHHLGLRVQKTPS